MIVLAIIGFLVLLGLGTYFLFAGALTLWVLLTFGSVKKEGLVPAFLFGAAVLCYWIAFELAPFSISLNVN